MSTVDKKTLAGLLLGIGALAFAAKKGNQGSRGFFPAPTGKAPKGQGDTFTEEQDDIFFSFKQNAPKQPTTRSQFFTAELAQKDRIVALQRQKSAKQQSLRQLQRSLAQDTFGDATAIAQMQNQMNIIQAQITDLQKDISELNFDLDSFEGSEDPYEIAEANAIPNKIRDIESQIAAAQTRLSNVVRVLPQAQKTRMQAQVTSISTQVADLQAQITEANNKLTELKAQTAAASAKFGTPYTFQEYFDEFSERGYTPEAAARYESDAAENAWKDWEKQMERYRGWGEVAPKFTSDGEDTSGAMSGTGFKDGTKLPDLQGKFSGTSSSSNPFAPTFKLPNIT